MRTTLVRALTSALLAASALSLPAAASALDLYGVDLKIGVRGGPNVSFLPRPVDVGEDDALNPQALFYGVGWNLGTALQVRAFDIVGLELGWFRSVDSGEATIELEEVLDCSHGPRCDVQEVGARIRGVSHHLPIALHLALPMGKARPYVATGVDLVFSRPTREYQIFEIDPHPSGLDPETQGDLLEYWDSSVEAQYYLASELNDAHREQIAGIIVGAGLNINVDQFEIPVEFRLNIYPATGDRLRERGDFPPSGTTAYDPNFTVRFNDTWNYQLFILFGFDYVIF